MLFLTWFEARVLLCTALQTSSHGIGVFSSCTHLAWEWWSVSIPCFAFTILDEAKTNYELALKESMHIKWRNPSLNIKKTRHFKIVSIIPNLRTVDSNEGAISALLVIEHI